MALWNTMAKASKWLQTDSGRPLPMWLRIAVALAAVWFLYWDVAALVKNGLPEKAFYAAASLASPLAWTGAMIAALSGRARERKYLMAFTTAIFGVVIGGKISWLIWMCLTTEYGGQIAAQPMFWIILAVDFAVPLAISRQRAGTAWTLCVLGAAVGAALLIYAWAPTPEVGWAVALLILGFIFIPAQTITFVSVCMTAFLAIVAGAGLSSFFLLSGRD